MHVSKDELERIVAGSKSRRECLEKMGLHPKSNSSYRRLKHFVTLYGIDVSHFSGYAFSKEVFQHRIANTTPIEAILEGKHPLYKTAKLRVRLLANDILPHRCSVCELTEWRDKPIPLELDHINGIPTDHRLDNLRLICPNCHAQTPNFCGKNTEQYHRRVNKLTVTEKLVALNKPLVDIVLSSDIDFSSYGWVEKAARLINKRPQKIHMWMKRYMPEFYSHCFKRKIRE